MKKLLTIICILAMTTASAQDSVKVTVDWQARDIEYSVKHMAGVEMFENLFDTLKVKFRVQNPPTGNTTVSVTAYTIDWVYLYDFLNYDHAALNNNVTSRLKSLLLAVGQTHLSNLINGYDTKNQDAFQNGRQYGRFRLRRTNN